MKRLLRLPLAATSTLMFALAGTTAAHAASLAQLACSDNIKANISFYDIGFTNTVPTGGDSGGAGKLAVAPLHIHTSVVNFLQFFPLVSTGRHLETCTLTVRANGDTLVYTFSELEVSSLTALGKSAQSFGQPNISYLDVQLAYEKIEVQSNGQDDGGWDITKNTPE